MTSLFKTLRKVKKLESELSSEVRASLVGTLFASPVTLFLGGAVGSASAFTIALHAKDSRFTIIAVAIFFVAAARLLHALWAQPDGVAEAAAGQVELSYEWGAWIYSALMGTMTFMVVMLLPSGPLHLLAGCTSTGYAAAISARNAARPTLAMGQMCLAALPLSLACGLQQDPIYWVLCLGNLAMVAGLIDITVRTYSAALHAISMSQAREEFWASRLDALPQMVWATGPDFEEYYNRPWRTFVGVDFSQPGAPSRADLVHPDDREEALQTWERCRAEGVPYEAEYRLRHTSGEYRWIISRAIPERDVDGEIIRWHGTCTDVHERVTARKALKESEALQRAIIQSSPDCVLLIDLDRRIKTANDAALNASAKHGWNNLTGRRWAFHQDPASERAATTAVAKASAGEIGRATITTRQADGEAVWWDVIVAPVRAESGDVSELVVLSRDITHQKAAEEQVRWSAVHDALTELPNRAAFQDRLQQEMDCHSTGSGGFALLILDLDNFKQVNDSLGHDAGDTLLKVSAERLERLTRPQDFVARLGGDEFAIILSGLNAKKDVRAVANRILVGFAEPWTYAGRLVDAHVSIGASIFPSQGADASKLMKSADIALYVAKLGGRNQVAVFRNNMRSEMQKRATMLSLARDAITNDLIVPYYQPKVDLQTGRINGFEALLRWRHPTRGIQAPATIAAAFEDLRLAEEISDRIIDGSIRDMRHWLDLGIDFGHVAINAAAADFRRGNFAEKLLERLEWAGVPTRCVQLEVTETVFLGRGADYVARALNKLSSAGVRVALDDFGTGYASLSHLKHFPVSMIKIDRSFVQNVENDPDNAAIIRAVINLARSLSMEVVAEGIETPAQEAYLIAQGCGAGQGYLFGKPGPAERVPHLLSRSGGSQKKAA